MTETDLQPATTFIGADLTGAQFQRTQLNDARFRMCDLSGVVMRDLSLSGASIDGCEIDGLRINGVEVAPLIEAELTRRWPARALRRATDPASLRQAWEAVQAAWAPLYERAIALPDGSADISVDGEWSFSETVRHTIFVTDAWLGAAQAIESPFHAWGVPFSDLPEFIEQSPADIGIDSDARPSLTEILEVRADRVERVREFLAGVTPEQLKQEVSGPIWGREPVTVLRCLRVILNEECEHLRFAQRDLDVVSAPSSG